MLAFYVSDNGVLVEKEKSDIDRHGYPVVWVDILDITVDEEQLIEQMFGIDVPTREEMALVELSSRLYVDGNAIFATATMLSNTGTADIEQNPVTFVLTKGSLLTLRYSDPTSFRLFTSRLGNVVGPHVNGPGVLCMLLETITDRLAEILTQTGHRLDGMTKSLFFDVTEESQKAKQRDLEELMRLIGVNGDLTSKVAESLHSFARMIGFLRQLPIYSAQPEQRAKLTALAADVTALVEHVNFLSNKVAFLLDATLGMLSIQQNAIIKIFSVAAVIFLPPTLVASIYGMNFDVMPELHTRFGYPLALLCMVVSAIVPYAFFRRKGWL